MAQWDGTGAIQAANLIAPANLLTLTAVDNYTLTIPESLIAAGRNVSNTFTQPMTIDLGTGIESLKLVDGATTKAAWKWIGTNVYLDLPSVEPTNKLLNPTFDTDLASWSEVPSYILNDQFTTDRVAGAVNGTSAEPTGGTRTVVDSGSKTTVGTGKLNFASGTASGDPRIVYGGFTRTPGLTLTSNILTGATNATLYFGLATVNNPSNFTHFDSAIGYAELSLVEYMLALNF